jgi:copper chaperone CopZ
MKYIFSLALLFSLTTNIFAQLGDLTKKAKDTAGRVKSLGISNDDIGAGLKEALSQGATSASSFLSAKDGYFKSAYKILLPEEARKVTSKLKAVPGFQNVESDLEERMNRAAESAAVKAKPIFIHAIKQMSFQDALSLLQGNPDAATRFLEKTTSTELYGEFKPIIQAALDEVNARSLWRDATTAYNKIPLTTKTNTELDDHVTKMALKGLFSLVEEKEKGIRSDVSLRNTDLLKRVFEKQDK